MQSSEHAERWERIGRTSSFTRLRLTLFITYHSPVPKGDMINHLMETGQFSKRGSCVRVVDRHLSEMQRKGIINIDDKNRISISKGIRLVVGEPFGAWLALGAGVAILFFGMSVIESNLLLIACASAFLMYSISIPIYYLRKFSPY
jgi:hypothetical protein